MHTPVLLKESIEALNVEEGKKYIDCTYGLGGHSRAITETGGKVLALDWDRESVEKQAKKLVDENIILVQSNYADIKTVAEKHNWVPCRGVIFDLGLSMDQIRHSERGFSYEERDEKLDMRIDTHQSFTAADVVNSYAVDELYDIFTKYSEELNSRPIAEAIHNARRVEKIETVGRIIDIIEKVTKDRKSVARIFQALRIKVNNEYENIEKGIMEAYEIVEDGGRVVVITFHPGEDRLVKLLARKEKMRLTTKKPVTSSSNRSFERSAKLRIIQK